MRRPVDAYLEGYEKGQKDSAGGALAEIAMGMLLDDPGGHFAAGYQAGAGGKKFNPPPDHARKADAEVNPFDDKVAIKTVCPNCGEMDWFEWKFLGRLTDPVCGHTWYVGSGRYSAMQIHAIFRTSAKFAKHGTRGLSGEGAWIGKIYGWFVNLIIGFCFRLEAAIIMIPIQALMGLSNSRTNRGEVIGRSIVLALFIGTLGILAYEIRQGPKVQSGMTPQPSIIQPPVVLMLQSGASQAAVPQENTSLDRDGLFALAPDYTRHWAFAVGSESPEVAYVGGHLQVRARPVSGNWGRFIANLGFTGDLDITFTYNHQGFGRTTVGLWSVPLNDWQVWADLDTDDTPCLYLNSRNQPNASLCPSRPYLNRNLALRIQTAGNLVTFYADNAALNSFALSNNGPYEPAIAVSNVNWKSGENITTFYGVTVNIPSVSASPPPSQSSAGEPLALSKPCEDLANVRSALSTTPATLVLRNTTDLQLGIYWIDFDGQRKSWGGVNPGQEVKEQTYIGHPWLLVDGRDRCHGLFLPGPGESVAIVH